MKSKRKRDKQSRRSVVSISNVSVGFETLHSFRRNNYKLVSASDGFNCLSISGTNSAQLHGAICHSNHLQHTEDEVIEMVHHFGGYSKTRHKKLVTHVAPHASAMSLLKRAEISTI